MKTNAMTREEAITDALTSAVDGFIQAAVPQFVAAIEAHGGGERASIKFTIRYIPPGATSPGRVESSGSLTLPTGKVEHAVEMQTLAGGGYQISLGFDE